MHYMYKKEGSSHGGGGEEGLLDPGETWGERKGKESRGYSGIVRGFLSLSRGKKEGRVRGKSKMACMRGGVGGELVVQEWKCRTNS